jgi:hypothetical protein
MATYAVALILGLSRAERAGIVDADLGCLPRVARSHARPAPAEVQAGRLPAGVVDRLERLAEFTMDLTKPNGRIVQVGDNDSGRFLRLIPGSVVDDASGDDPLDHRHLVGAIHGLLPRPDFAEFAGPWVVEGEMIRALAGGRTLQPSRAGVTAASAVSVNARSAEAWAPRADRTPTFVIPLGAGARAGLRTFAYPDFGAYGYRSDRVYLLVRCGPVGQNGLGGHAHNDQLAVELSVDGEDWIRDPGTYLYTPLPEVRNRYRSSRAHFAPRFAGREAASLDIGLFELERGTEATCLRFDEELFIGRVRFPGGGSVLGTVRLEDDRVEVDWLFEGCEPDPSLASSDWRAWLPRVRFSPGYGVLEVGVP